MRNGSVKSVCRAKRAEEIWAGDTVSEMYLATVSWRGSTIMASVTRPSPRRIVSRPWACADEAGDAAETVMARVHDGKAPPWQQARYAAITLVLPLSAAPHVRVSGNCF